MAKQSVRKQWPNNEIENEKQRLAKSRRNENMYFCVMASASSMAVGGVMLAWLASNCLFSAWRGWRRLAQSWPAGWPSYGLIWLINKRISWRKCPLAGSTNNRRKAAKINQWLGENNTKQ